MGNGRGQRWEYGQKEREGDGELEESEGCSSVSALWSRASWDSRILCQDPTLQNQSLSTGHKDKDIHTCARSLTQPSAHSHNISQPMSSVLVLLQQGNLSMSRQCVIADRCDVM